MDDMEQYLEDTRCPICEGEGAYMGTLGNNPYFRCMHCGADYTENLSYVSQGSVELTIADDDS